MIRVFAIGKYVEFTTSTIPQRHVLLISPFGIQRIASSDMDQLLKINKRV